MPAVMKGVQAATGLGVLVNTLSRPIGIEVELSSWGSLQKEWKPKNLTYNVMHDGSVTSGNELVTCPLAGDKFLAAMIELGGALFRCNTDVDATCGLHVHVDGRDLSYWDIRRLLRMYLAVEDDIYTQLATRERSRNRFCGKFNATRREIMPNLLAATTTSTIKKALYELLYGTWDFRKISHIRCDKYGAGRDNAYARSARYLGLNLHSWLHRGTVEFRMHEGTVDVQDLVCWPLWCGWFVETATKLNDNQAAKVSSLMDFTKQYMPGFVATWAAAKARRLQAAQAA